jgi:hypothetical protein
MLDRIALHQTRLVTPGLGLDAKGVALGAKGLLLFPTVDRLVAWLSVYTRERSLEDLLPSLELRYVRSSLGTQEMTLTFAAESSDRMDRAAEISRLVGAFTFTGTSRHFVQYRDAAAPFGYDAADLLSTEAPLALYHDEFSQTYEEARKVDLRSLLVRLMPRAEPATKEEPGPRYVVAEQGLGPALIHYLVRSRVDGEVTVGEWPPLSSFDEAPVRRYLVRISEMPARMGRLLRETPGLTCFLPAGQGVAVELGFRHPVELRACPVFDPDGLVLLRGNGGEAWSLPHLPAMGDLRAFAQVELAEADTSAAVARRAVAPDALRVPVRMMPSPSAWRGVSASVVPLEQVPLLRRLAYALAPAALRATRAALTDRGVFLSCPQGIDAIPLGTFFVEAQAGLFVAAGFEPVPRIAADVLYRAIAGPDDHTFFLGPDARVVAVPNAAFVPLETLVLEAARSDAAQADLVESALAEATIELTLDSVGLFPLGDAEPLALPPALPGARVPG